MFKKPFILFIAAALLVAMPSCKRYETVPGDALQTKIYTLDNGMKIFMSVNKEQPRIQTYIAVKVGSKNDPSETTGLAHYFEHLMFKGTEHFGTIDYEAEKPMLDEIEQLFEVYRKTTDEAERQAIYHRIDSVSYEASKLAIPNEYDKLMAVIGADGTNAWTSGDETVYTEDIPSNQIDNWARIQADRFRHGVIRGFHTELETIYEEKNMSLTQDSRKLWEAMDQALFPHHPYGKQTTLGSQEHLKNPSITNVKKYHDVYYVPNNIAVCVSGDFDPDEMVAAIEKYFGDWEPNPEIPELQFEPEEPITEPIVREVYGLEAENVALAWRLPAPADLKTAAVAEIAGSVLFNQQAGLMDLDINQQQKALFVYGGYEAMADYAYFLGMGNPKEGQTLEEVRDLILEEVAKLRSGDFDEALLAASVNNTKLNQMRRLEYNDYRARYYVDAFINGIPWKDACKSIDRLAAVTKEDVVAFANEYLGENAYAVVYKRQGEDKTIQKVTAPKITPIVTNRDEVSDFLTEIQNSVVKPIEPVFVNFDKDMSKFALTEGADVLYKKNELNDVFNVQIIYNRGTQQDPALGLAMNYLSYLGTPEMSAEEMASKMYGLACSYSGGAGATQSSIRLVGLSENMGEALRLVENLVQNAVPDEAILANLKADMLKDRADAKKSQSSCFSALERYAFYGPDFIKATTISNEALMALSSEDLLGKVRDVFQLGHEIFYYGPMSENEVKSTLADAHYVAEGAQKQPEQYALYQLTPSDRVLMAQYDAPQLYYIQYSDRGEKFDPAQAGDIALYNEYFGGGMNTIVFQEMREARGLAYSAYASLDEPSVTEDTYSFMAFIATQNDKMRQAIEAFDEIINNMPESEAAFAVAKEALLSRLRTQRTTGMDVLRSYVACRRLGLAEPSYRAVFEKAQDATLADVVATQQKWVKDRHYTYMILGDIKDLDTKYLSTLGPVQTLSLEEIFGY
ncbi:MAG: insulinase family protein [Bacteroidales bacterium]|nr:insulinase family protein [Bacteroidales bacterium]